MARKAVKGYAEKNYYDNTRFNGGIVTSNDALNEGYFKHLVNFDIADTGQSLTPRKGFLTTTFKKDDTTYIFNNKTIYFYDENIGEYIFVSFTDENPKAYRCTFDDLEENKFENISPIANIDITDIGESHMDISPITTNRAIRIVDEYNVTAYVIKAKVNDEELWLKLYYREIGTEDPDDDIEHDTLVVSYLDMSQLVNYVDTNLRNIASSESIIPDPMQKIYEADAIPEGHYDRMPMMYIRQNGKYLINTINNMKNFQVIPNFYIAEDIDTDYRWAYTYEIFSTNKDLEYADKNLIYKSPIFYIDSTLFRQITSLSEMLDYNWHTQFSLLIKDSIDVVNNPIADVYNVDTKRNQYKTFLSNNGFNNTDVVSPEYIIYLVPLEENIETSTIYLDKSFLGPYGLLKYFGDTIIANNPQVQELDDYNEFISTPSMDALLAYHTHTIFNELYYELELHSATFENVLEYAQTYGFGVYVKKFNDVNKSIFDYDAGKFQDCVETISYARIYSWDSPPMDVNTFMHSKEYNDIITNSFSATIKVLPYKSKVKVVAGFEYDPNEYPIITKGLFPELTTQKSHIYYLTYWPQKISINEGLYDADLFVPFHEPDIFYFNDDEVYNNNDDYVKAFASSMKHPFHTLFFINEYGQSTDLPMLSNWYTVSFTLKENTSLFTLNDKLLIGDFNITKPVYKYLYDNKYFHDGLIMNFYMLKVPEEEVVKDLSRDEILTKSSKLSISRQLIRTSMEPTTYIEYLTEEPVWIAKAKESLSYTSLLGSHLVLYVDNKLFISKEGMQYYYIYQNMFEYPEPIVKVIQYKELLLVFTTQNLYAVYLEEVVIEVANGTNEDGSIKYVQQTSYEFRTQTVLYNLMVDKKYADAIQVYNQMVLFYSSDGQMFLIKPTAAITSDTRFSIQYFNKSANDILLNYKDYMQQRLQIYGIDAIIKDVEIKVSATLNYIKIFYNAPGLITYILIYDILNNRYYVYDTVAFTNVKYLHYIPTGELYITDYDPEGEGNGDLYFTIPYALPNETDNNVDISHYDNFNPYSIESEIDSGVLNLNNHLKKRFKDLHVIYKNLNANHLEFAIEVFVDDVPIITYIDPRLEIRSILGMDTLVVVDEKKTTQLVKKKIAELIKQTTLFDFTEYTSNKLITHRTNIVSKGKTFRTRLTFSSKGRYKIQGFGIIYKEHTV